jgi:hypothetical protein
MTTGVARVRLPVEKERGSAAAVDSTKLDLLTPATTTYAWEMVR